MINRVLAFLFIFTLSIHFAYGVSYSGYVLSSSKSNEVVKIKIKTKQGLSLNLKLMPRILNADQILSTCPLGSEVLVSGSEKNKTVEIKSMDTFICSSPKKIDKSLDLQGLSYTLKEPNEYKVVRVKGYVAGLRVSDSISSKKSSFTMIDRSKKYSLKISILERKKDVEIASFNCSEGEFVDLMVLLKVPKRINKNLGRGESLFIQDVKCTGRFRTLSKKEIEAAAKNKKKTIKTRINKYFTKYKIENRNKKPKYDLMKKYQDEGFKLCKENRDVVKLCNKFFRYVRRTFELNQISFKINTQLGNIADIDKLRQKILKPVDVELALGFIKSLYGDGYNYIIGIPKKCYGPGKYNPSDSSFPYRELKISDTAKKNITNILERLNRDNLKCKSVLESIYFVAQWDDDKQLDVYRLDLKKSNYLYRISNDF